MSAAAPAPTDAGHDLAGWAERGFVWLRDAAWPLWLEHGVDWRRRAFHEQLDHDTLGCSAPFRRLRVAARQTFVFARAAAHGVPRAADAVVLGLAFLGGPARHPDGGYAWRFGLDNAATDPTRDLYDHAFVLLALAGAAPVVGPERLRADAHALVHLLDRAFAHPRGGFHEAVPPAWPRRQNPHMHLLEAVLAAFDAFGDAVFLDRADAVVALFAGRLFQARDGALPEFYDDTLEPHREAGRFRVEPGHHAEWIWLLDRYRAAVARAGRRPAVDRLDALAAALRAFVDRFGVEPRHGVLVDGLWSDGAVQMPSARLWPQLERLKAEFTRPAGEDAAAVAAAFDAAFRYLEDARPGLWRERRARDGAFVHEPAPATSLYHLTGAFLDVRARADFHARGDVHAGGGRAAP